MAKYPSLPLFTDSYLGDTRHLTTIQHGAYLLMLIVAWRTKNCCLPNNDDYLAKICGMDSRTWGKHKNVILEFWEEDEDRTLFQPRLRDERHYCEGKRRKNVEAGKLSALKNKERHSTNVITNVQPKHNQPTPTPTPTKIKIEDTNVSLSPQGIEGDLCPYQKIISIWNEVCGVSGLPKAEATDKRKRLIKVRWNSEMKRSLDHWRKFCELVAQSNFHRGENERSWRATIDWAIRPDTITKFFENNNKSSAKKWWESGEENGNPN